ncbi:MAG: DeoR family transcriptional regulator [Minisyncoccia bacterium]|jgi:hypothetical protein
MKESGKMQFVLKKAYEISYAVFRIGSRTASSPLKEHLERQALSLLDAATVENYAWVSTVSRAIEYLVRFGGDVGLIHEANKEIIISQLASMNAAIAGPEKAVNTEEVFLDDIFSGHGELFPANHTAKRQRQPAKEIETTAEVDSNEGNGGERATARQAAILEKIRQSGNCRIKDIQELFPDCSERTIRYDLQALLEQSLVERIGGGGPSVFYRVKQDIPRAPAG